MEDDYYAEIERHFIALRGSPLFITPAEWQLIHRWHERQIPLRIVKEGLALAFERRKSPRPVRRLSYCRQAVEAHHRRFQEALAGAPPAEENGAPRVEIRGYLEELSRELEAVAGKCRSSRPELSRTLGQAAEELRTLAAGELDRAALPALERELDRIDARVLEAADSALGEEERRRCRDEAESSLREYRSRMPEDVYRSALTSAERKRLRAVFGIPALSLFYL